MPPQLPEVNLNLQLLWQAVYDRHAMSDGLRFFIL